MMPRMGLNGSIMRIGEKETLATTVGTEFPARLAAKSSTCEENQSGGEDPILEKKKRF